MYIIFTCATPNSVYNLLTNENRNIEAPQYLIELGYTEKPSYYIDFICKKNNVHLSRIFGNNSDKGFTHVCSDGIVKTLPPNWQSDVKNLQYDATQLVLTDKMMDKFNNFVFKFDTDQCIPMSIISKNVSELKF